MSFHKHLDYNDLHAPSSQQVENGSGVLLTKGTVVRLDGFGAAFPIVKVASPPVLANFGIVQADIPIGARGIVTCLGLMRGLNTSAFPVGTALYSDSSGALSISPLGSIVASVVKTSATDGIIYAVASVDLIMGGSAVGWDVDGNSGTTAGTNYIGTNDAVDFVTKTNGLEALRVTQQQRLGIGTSNPGLHVEQKSHSSPNASGLQTETFYLETNANTLQTAYALNIANPETVRFTFEATARATDGSGRAMFIRSGLAYRESSNVQLQSGTWQTDNTIKSDNGFSVGFTLGVSSITFTVKAATAANTHWTGRVLVQRVV